MYLAVAVVLSCLAFTFAEEKCGVLEKAKVQREWANIYGVSASRTQLATLVWKDFFRRHPDEVKRFERVHGDNIYSADFRAHMVRVFAGFDLLIGSLLEEDVFNSAMAHYTKMHVEKGVNTEIVKEFGKSLGYVLPQFMDGHVAIEAWRPCYQLIAAGVSAVSIDEEPIEKMAPADASEDKVAAEDKAAAENEVV